MQNLVSSHQCGGGSRRLVLLALANFAKPDGSNVFASVATLALYSELSVRQVQRTLQELLEEGLITHVGEHPCPNGYTRIYQLNVSAIETLPALADIGRKRGGGVGRSCHPVTPDSLSRMTSATASPLTAATASPDRRQDDTQTRQGNTTAAAATDDPWAPLILEAAGPGLADPKRHPRVMEDLFLCIPRWRAHGWDLEADVIATVRSKTAKPRPNGPLYSLSVLEPDMEVRHSARRALLSPFVSPTGETRAGGRANLPDPGALKLNRLRFERERFLSGNPFREHSGSPPTDAGWEAWFDDQIAEEMGKRKAG